MAERRPSNKQPERVGPFLIGGSLGGGGNAVVYEATRDGTVEPVALKVVRVQKADREPYRRFAREVDFLRSLTMEDGVLPLIDASVPAAPTNNNPAWLAMPIALPICEALSGATLETVVEAVATIAETLTRLATRGIAHRDIKPGNLYQMDGHWLLGDFGLIDIPDLEELTREGRPLGPAHFTAYELIARPESADARPADVYSLAKTLWVLATEQRYPPEGNQSARGSTGLTIADLRPHRRAAQLDSLIDSMTQIRPELRPTMEQVARDLRGWLEMSPDEPSLEIDELRAKIRAKLQPQLAEVDIQAQRRRQAEEATTTMLHLVDPLNLELRTVHPNAVLDRRYPDDLDRLLHSQPAMGRPPSVFYWYTVSWIESETGPNGIRLKFGCGIDLDSTGELSVRTVIVCGRPRTMGGNYVWQDDVRTAPVGSIEAEQDMRAATQALFTKFPEALNFFHDHLPGDA